MYATLLLCAAAAFAFQILATSWLGFCLMGWYPQQAFAVAVVGSSAAALIVGFFGRPRARATLGWLAAAFALALLASQIGIVLVQAWNVSTLRAPGPWGFGRVLDTIVRNHAWLIGGFGAALLIPFLVHGLFVAALFRRLPSTAFPKLIAYELVGAALGSLGGALAIDGLPQPAVCSAILVCALSGAWLWPVSARRKNRWRTFVTACAAAAVAIEWLGAGLLELPADAHFLARDYRREADVGVVETTWTTYSRVTTAKVGSNFIGTLGNGEGQASLRPFQPNWPRNPKDLTAALAAALGGPRASLVVFAGAGQELMSLRIAAAPDAVIDGIELNGRLIEQAKRIRSLKLARFFEDPRVHLWEGDARRFLEQRPASYDLVLYSWPGTTAAQHLGLGGSTVGPCYTKEGLSAALRALKPGGTLVILGGLKRELIALLREWSDQRGGVPLRKQLVLLKGAVPGPLSGGNAIRVLIRPDGFTPEQIARLDPELEPASHRVVWADGKALHGNLPGITRLAVSPKWRAFAEEIGLRFLRDDFPMYFPPTPGVPNGLQAVLYALFLLSTITGLAGRMLARRTPTLPLSLGGYFIPVGACFVALQSFILTKMALYFGSPTRALAFGLPLHLLAVAAGLIGRRDWQDPSAARRCFLGTAIGLLWLIGAEAIGRRWLVGAPLLLCWLGWLLFLLPVGYYGGQLYPRGLCLMGRQSPRTVLWAMAVDTAAGAWALVAVPWIVYSYGLRLPLLAMAALYGAGAWLGFRRRSSAEQTPAFLSSDQRKCERQQTGGKNRNGEVVIHR